MVRARSVLRDERGLGALDPTQLAALFERREPLGPGAIAEARALWRAYAGPDPATLAGGDPILPFARVAIRRHCERFPSVANGLDDVEHATLAALDRAPDFVTLFRTVTTSGTLRDLGLGDVQFAAMLRDLAAGPTPLVEIAGRERGFERWRISRTRAGIDVLEGRIDRLALAPLDRWLGGVHLRSGAPLWRWDADRSALVAA